MQRQFKHFLVTTALVPTLIVGCAQDDFSTGPDTTSTTRIQDGSTFTKGAAASMGVVFTMSNEAEGNQIEMLLRDADGFLTRGGDFPTGGLGSGGGLGNQSGLRAAEIRGQRYLFACNAGSSDISMIAVNHDGLQVLSVTPSGGERPISIAVHGNYVYVLNAGGDGNITGFKVVGSDLKPVKNSTQPLSDLSAVVAPAQIAFSPDGSLLAVTEKVSNKIVTYVVDSNGRAGAPIVNDSVGQTPFGFRFDMSGDFLIVSEAFGGATDASAVSSYYVAEDGHLSPITPSSMTSETAACWIEIAGDGRYAYTTNAGSGTISGYYIDPATGELTLLDADGVTGSTGDDTGPLDMAAAGRYGQFVYVSAGRTDEIVGFAVGEDGSLTLLNRVGDLAAPSNGVAAW